MGEIQVDTARLREVCDRYGIATLAIFGSFARGQAGATSDVDLLYTLRPGWRLGWEIETLSDELRELFGGRTVDLVSTRALNPRLRTAILREAREFYAAA